MKKLFFSMLIGMFCLLYACDNKMNEYVTYNINEPVMMSLDEFRSAVAVSNQPQEISQKGKMCFYNGYLYISEPEKGIHIIDNRNPSSPQNVGFIELLGNVDLAIRNDLLYADSYIDLVWFDINSPSKPELKGRVENVFPQGLPVVENNYGIDYSQVYQQNGINGIVVGWKLVERKEEVKNYGGGGYDYDMIAENSFDKSANGANGSMSRFGIYKDYMYAVVNGQLTVFSLSGNQPQKAVENMYLERNVETIFSYEDKLFMGTPTGLLIYSVENPLSPQRRSFIGHIWGCDPVVVENNIAYVTVHSGNLCGQDFNELIIIDVNNVDSPKRIASYAMTKPKGLGIDNGTLFICDDGLKIYDAQDPFTLMGKQLVHHKGMDAYDVIPFDNVLMMIAEDGIYQYDYKDLNKITLLSKIAIKE